MRFDWAEMPSQSFAPDGHHRMLQVTLLLDRLDMTSIQRATTREANLHARLGQPTDISSLEFLSGHIECIPGVTLLQTYPAQDESSSNLRVLPFP